MQRVTVLYADNLHVQTTPARISVRLSSPEAARLLPVATHKRATGRFPPLSPADLHVQICTPPHGGNAYHATHFVHANDHRLRQKSCHSKQSAAWRDRDFRAPVFADPEPPRLICTYKSAAHRATCRVFDNPSICTCKSCECRPHRKRLF
jgi:hypothetical protein